MKRLQMRDRHVIWGGHSLSVMFMIDTNEKLNELELAMKEVVSRGGEIFEIAYGLVGGPITWNDIATAAKNAGIKEIVICHFWGTDGKGKPLTGDPLGNPSEAVTAVEVFVNGILGAVNTLRMYGIRVTTINGPTHVCLGKDYSHLAAKEIRRRMVNFLRLLGKLCAEANLILAVEFLRPVEDTVIHGTRAMLNVLKAVNRRNVKLHIDTFHCIECDEDPASSIRLARKWIYYVHINGNGRLAPGQTGDLQEWVDLITEILKINVKRRTIRIVFEPFGRKTCRECRPLGKGLPKMLPFPKYLNQTVRWLNVNGLPINALLTY